MCRGPIAPVRYPSLRALVAPPAGAAAAATAAAATTAALAAKVAALTAELASVRAALEASTGEVRSCKAKLAEEAERGARMLDERTRLYEEKVKHEQQLRAQEVASAKKTRVEAGARGS